MYSKKRFFTIAICVGGLASLVGWRAYRYVSNDIAPTIALHGFVDQATYAKQVSVELDIKTGYKLSQVLVRLDGKPVQGVYDKLVLDTTNLAAGLHTLEVTAIDGSYKRPQTTKVWHFNVDNDPLHAALASDAYTIEQGKTLHLKVCANKELDKAMMSFGQHTFTFAPDAAGSTTYECFVPVHCEEPASEHRVNIDLKDRVGNTVALNATIKIVAFPFKKQRGFRVDAQKLEQEREVSMSEKILDQAMEKWLADSPDRKLWSGPFEYPIEVQRMTTPFGEIRVTPERGKYLHKGVDLINLPRSVVWASQTGKVIIKDRFFLTGNTIVLDHGRGVMTVYAHLDSFADVVVGDVLKKGSPIGKLGKTGYATGDHLHWELRVHNVPVDPCEWTTKIY